MAKVKKFKSDYYTISKLFAEETETTVETIDCLDGCLIDSLLIDTGAGILACYETYQNEWSSIYKCEYQKHPANDVWKHWEAFSTAYHEQFGYDE